MYIPSYDFKLFKIPNFSPLEAQEYNATTQFSANTPLAYVDYSINQLAGLMQPNNPYPYNQRQFPAEIIPTELDQFFQQPIETVDSLRDRLTRVRNEAQKKLDEIGGNTVTKTDIQQSNTQNDCPSGYSRVTPFGISWLSYCGKQLVSDGQGTMGDKKAPAGLGQLETFMNALPQGSGVFLIAVIVIILLFLFVKR